MALIFNDENFKREVLESDQLCIIDFWAEWCGPCRALSPIIDELSDMYQGKVKIGKVNVDDNPHLSIQYNVVSIPVILFIKNGKIVNKSVGVVPKTLLEKKIQEFI